MPLKDLLQKNCTIAQWQQILEFVELLKTANQTVNLVSRKDIDNIIEHHVAPSFAYKILNRINEPDHILDIGSGGGFPGIINAILYPTSKFILVDSTKKKVTFLQDTIKKLALQNIEAVWSRVEDLSKSPDYQHQFDHVTVRAVAPLKDLVKWSQPLLKPNGTLEALKGGDITTELAQVKLKYEQYYLPAEYKTYERLKGLVLVSIACA
ncbi:MAG: 16S rRNA (guanine(527)-N(7))-methyltransferase RsmG [Patescibacteria group bacterium]